MAGVVLLDYRAVYFQFRSKLIAICLREEIWWLLAPPPLLLPPVDWSSEAVLPVMART